MAEPHLITTFAHESYTYMNIELLSEAEKTSLNELIDSSNNILICCHKSPDGDALGSSLAWAAYLTGRGKHPTIVVPDVYPALVAGL